MALNQPITDSNAQLFSDLNNFLLSSPANINLSLAESDVLLLQLDCLVFMSSLLDVFPSGLFDMIFADPPYFLSNDGITCQSGKMVSVNKGGWDKSKGPDLNHAFNFKWLSLCQKLLKPNGTIWISGTQHVIHSVGFAIQQLGFKILNDITWEKPAPPPNLSCRYFTHATETIIWAAKNNKSKHYFNYALMKQINAGKQMKSIWAFSPPSKEEKKFGKHPTQKPGALLDRIILASTIEGDLVFDPFAGSSTTGVSAVKFNRKFVGCEIDPVFITASIQRLKDALNSKNSTLPFEEV